MPVDLNTALRSVGDDFAPTPIDASALISRYNRRRSARIATGAGAMVAAGAVLGTVVWQNQGGPNDTLRPAASPSPSLTGRSWLIDVPTPRHADGTYYDPEDEDGIVTPSSAPRVLEDFHMASSELRAAYAAAGLPTGTTITLSKEELGAATAKLTLPDGTGLLMIRDRYDHPIRFRASSRDGVGTQILLEDVPGTRSAALIDNAFGYSLPGDKGSAGRAVVVVAPDGTTITWVAPSDFDLARLRGWAFGGASGSAALRSDNS